MKNDALVFSDKTGAWREKYRYAVYDHKLIAKNGEVYVRSFIVIKNDLDVIVRFTNLHRYVGVYENKVFVPITSNTKNKMLYICKMLNYVLIKNYSRFKIEHVFNVTREALESFFADYAQECMTNGKYRSEQSVERCVNAVVDYQRKLYRAFGNYVTLKPDDLYNKTTVPDRHGQLREKLVPEFQVKGFKRTDRIFRELPTSAFKVLINLAFKYAPDIAFAMCIQAFAGLRAGEVLNVRQEENPLGGGIAFTYVNGKVVKAEIDITKELPMRSDGVICGSIKKERRQSVYLPFLDAFMVAYERHKRYLSGREYEKKYSPMFVDKRGLAMTYDVYYKRFSELVEKHFRPTLLSSEDPICNVYGQLLYENRIGLHVLRHWFSVQLVLYGEDIAQIQYWRGDKNPESAFVYLQNKGDLLQELEKANNSLAEILIEQGSDAEYD